MGICKRGIIIYLNATRCLPNATTEVLSVISATHLPWFGGKSVDFREYGLRSSLPGFEALTGRGHCRRVTCARFPYPGSSVHFKISAGRNEWCGRWSSPLVVSHPSSLRAFVGPSRTSRLVCVFKAVQSNCPGFHVGCIFGRNCASDFLLRRQHVQSTCSLGPWSSWWHFFYVVHAKMFLLGHDRILHVRTFRDHVGVTNVLS